MSKVAETQTAGVQTAGVDTKRWKSTNRHALQCSSQASGAQSSR